MDNGKKISEIREEYRQDALLESNLSEDPIDQFNKWMREALDDGIHQPNAMILATSTSEGRPSARTLLLKEVTDDGFVFFTNYLSQKGRELDDNPQASMVFLWLPVSRQIRVAGAVKRVDETMSDAYFSTRPRASKIGAWASDQSEVVESRGALEERFRGIEKKYQDGDIPRPSHWGGYILLPDHIEFWQGRPGRLHDRIVYGKQSEGQWMKKRLCP